MYFNQAWTDARLRHNNSRIILINDRALLALLWRPDIYFANARQSSFHDVMEPNFMLSIFPDGTIVYNCRYAPDCGHTHLAECR